jgi:hypothetical protein
MKLIGLFLFIGSLARLNKPTTETSGGVVTSIHIEEGVMQVNCDGGIATTHQMSYLAATFYIWGNQLHQNLYI